MLIKCKVADIEGRLPTVVWERRRAHTLYMGRKIWCVGQSLRLQAEEEDEINIPMTLGLFRDKRLQAFVY